jgi:putative toxin-antitoxin system antitoxin component (TIGR02293 family)
MPHIPSLTVPLPASAPEPQSLWQRVRDLLGLSSSSEGYTEASRIVGIGLDVETLDRLIAAGFTRQELFELVIPQRTLTHRKGKLARLSRDESDRVIRLARIFTFALEVFGNRDNTWHWLRTPKRLFDNKAPLDLLDTEAGAREVEEELVRIDEGMFI